MALFPSVICYLIYYYALDPHLRLARGRVLLPAAGVRHRSWRWSLLGERITAPLVAGGAVIFAGVYLTERG